MGILIKRLDQVIYNDLNLFDGDLVPYLAPVFHASNVDTDYHNFGHVQYEARACYDACALYVRDGELSRRAARNLVVAALFHDFERCGFSGPLFADRPNIEKAIDGLRRHIQLEDEPEREEIEKIIWATEYPYAGEVEDLSSQIMRDADLSQAFTPEWIQPVVFGLSKEMMKTPLEMLKLQKPFLGELRPLTSWGRARFSPREIADKLQEAERLAAAIDKHHSAEAK